MSRLQSTRRRLSLLAGSSFALGLLSVVGAGAVLAPTPAFADNECAPVGDDPSADGATPDSYICSGNYTSGITYDADGALVVNSTGAMNVGAEGIDLTAQGSDPVTFTATGTITGTGGEVLEVHTATGAVNVSTANISGTTNAVQGVVVSSGGAPITVTTGTVTVNNTPSTTAVEVVSSGGTGAVNVTTGSVTGRLRGILVQSGGGLNLTTSGTVAVNSTTTGGGVGQIAAIDVVTTGTGSATLNIVSATGVTGNAIRTNVTGNATINTTGSIQAGVSTLADATSAWVMDLTTGGGRRTTVNNTGAIRSTANTAAGNDDMAIRGAGAGAATINNGGLIRGVVDFSAQAGGVIFNTTVQDPGSNNGLGWHTVGTSVFSAGADVLATSETGGIYTSHGGSLPDEDPDPFRIVVRPPAGGHATTFDFGAGEDAFNNAGQLILGEGSCSAGATDCNLTETVTQLVDLEAFNNSGSILMGSRGSGGNVSGEYLFSDRQPNDRLVMPGATFTGSGDSRIEMDVNYAGATGQTACIGSEEQTNNFYAAADCLDIGEGETAGQTLLTLRLSSRELNNTAENVMPALRGSYFPEGIVLIDVSGGTSAAGHFLLDPNSENYSSRYGGVIDEGLFSYALVYDADNQQHKLASLPGGAGELGRAGTAAHEIWRNSLANVVDRQTSLRLSEGDADAEAGLWVRGATMTTKREAVSTVDVFGNAWALNDTYEQNGYTVTVGVDYVAADTEDHGLVAGLSLGYAHSDLAFTHSVNGAEFSGITGGAYASYAAGMFFVDAALNANGMVMTSDFPALGLGADATLDTNAVSIGGQIEGGTRLRLWDSAFLEPLATLTYIKTSFDDTFVRATVDPNAPGNTLVWGDPTSLRAGLGARLGFGHDAGPLSLDYALLGRVWNEFEGENTLAVRNGGPDAPVLDDFGGRFGEVGASVTIGDDLGATAGFLSAGGLFQDEYRSVTASAGFRYRW